MKIRALWLGASVLTLLGWSGAAVAQTTPNNTAGASAANANSSDADGTEEVVVTAERRTENLQTAPLSATVMTGDQLAARGVTNGDGLQFISPAASVNNFGQGNDFNIRGIGKGEHNTQTSTGVITYRDGIATFPGYFTLEPYYDISSIEILRGPQGTFGGQNSTGGAVFVNTNNPVINGDYHGYMAGQLGSYSDLGTQGAVNIPLTNTLAARIAFNTEFRNSFYDFHGPGGTPYTGNPGNLNEYSARFSLLWQPSAALSVLWKTDGDYMDFGAYPADPFNAPNNPFNLTANSPQQAIDRGIRSMLKVEYQADSGITFRSLSSYQYAISQYKADLDGTATTNFTFGDYVPVRLWSQEFDIVSPDSGFITWTVGAYADYLKYWFTPPYKFYIDTPPGSIFSEYLLQGTNPEQHLAAFGQLGFHLTPDLELDVGGRYTHATTKNHGNVLQYGTFLNITQSADFSNFSGKVSLNWTMDPNNFLYGFVSTGFRPGGLNVPVGFGLPAPFRQETITDYEVGWKNISFGGHLRTQLDAFYDNYDNFQVTVGYPTFPTFGFELNVPNTTNIYGIEAQTQASFGDLSFDAGVAWMQSSLGQFFAHDPRVVGGSVCDPKTGPATPTCFNLSGNDQTYAPNFTFNASAQYDFHFGVDDTVTPRVNFGHVSQQWATLFEDASRGDRIEARDIWGGQLAWTHGDLTTTLYITNATDLEYVAALNSGLRFVGPPRQYGIRLMKAF